MAETDRKEQLTALHLGYDELATQAQDRLEPGSVEELQAIVVQAFVQNALIRLLNGVDPKFGGPGRLEVPYFDLFSFSAFTSNPGQAFMEDPDLYRRINAEAQRKGIRELVDLLECDAPFVDALGSVLEVGDIGLVSRGYVSRTSLSAIPGVSMELTFTDEKGLPKLHYIID